MVAVAGEFTELRTGLDRRFAEIDRAFDGLDRHVDRINEGLPRAPRIEKELHPER